MGCNNGCNHLGLWNTSKRKANALLAWSQRWLGYAPQDDRKQNRCRQILSSYLMRSLLRSNSAEASMVIHSTTINELRAYGLLISTSQSHHTKLHYVWRWSRFLGLVKPQIITTASKTLLPMDLSIKLCLMPSKTKTGRINNGF
jgi:hypothetical protein